MEITLTANKADVLAEVDIITAYIGAKNGKFNTFPTLESDRELIDHFWRDACAFVTAQLSAILVQDRSEGESITLVLRVNDLAIAQALNAALRGALARLVLARWQEIFETCPGAEQASGRQAVSCQQADSYQQAMELLSQIVASAGRNAITRRRIPPI